VPSRKLEERFPRTLKNLARAVREVPHVLVFDNGDLARPFRMVARFEKGAMVERHAPVPRWVPRGR
jgi:predicted ABC-type ATPase